MELLGGALKNKTNSNPVERIITKQSECAFTKEQGPVCSPRHLVNKMADFLKTDQDSVPSKPEHIVKVMKERMNCNSESCILKSKEFMDFAKISNITNILDEFFKPKGPALGFGLLSNFNIDDVLSQLSEKFPHFLHIPFQMRDFEKVGSELTTVDLAKEFRNGITSFGVVLNTDWSHGKGIHWYCLYGEKRGNTIELEYFNSSGREPLPETQAWLQKTKHYLSRELKIPVNVRYTTGIQFQNDDHSCGVYCLMYLWLRLEGIKPTWFTADTFNDKFMHEARKILFRHEK